MAYDTPSTPKCLCHNTRGDKIIWKLPQKKPPAVFVDNENGYTAIDKNSTGRQNTDIEFGNMKYCMGYTFYASQEEIGVGIFIDGHLYVATSQTIEDFFERTFEDTTQIKVSIVEVLQISYDTIFVSAICYVNEKVLYASKTISAMGIAIAIGTRVKSSFANPEELRKHSQYFNEETGEAINGTVTSSPSLGEMIVTYETYNGSHGFSSVSNRSNIGTYSSDVMIRVYQALISDINTLTESSISISAHSAISITTHQYLYLLFLSIDNIKIYVFDNNKSFQEVYNGSFKTKSCQNIFDNPYEGKLFYIPPSNVSKKSNFATIQSPIGVIYRYQGAGSIAVVSHIDNISACYDIKVTDTGLDLSYIEQDDGLVPTRKGEETECDRIAYSFSVPHLSINSSDEVFANYSDTKGDKSTLGADIHTVKSMSLFIPYS